MPKFLDTPSLYFDDVNLIAQPAIREGLKRGDIPRELNRIIVAPMDALVGPTFAQKAVELGLSVCLHRFGTEESQVSLFKSLDNKVNVFCAVGLEDKNRINLLLEAGARNFLIDIANGGQRDDIWRLMEYIRLRLGKEIPKLMLGNVHTGTCFQNLVNPYAQETYIRVGISNGAACRSKHMTGVNRGQVTEILECAELKDESTFLISDGGIKCPGDACKAFGLGADYVMMGGFFRGAYEAETYISGDGTYWGGASHKQQIKSKGKIVRHSEGAVLEAPEKLDSLENIVNELWGGISSCVAYQGFDNLSKFIGNGTFEIKK